MLLAQLLQGDVAADLDVVVELDAVLGDPVDVELDDVARQAEGRNADEGRAAARGAPRRHGRRGPSPELLRRGQAGRPGADDGHAAAGGWTTTVSGMLLP